MKKIENNNSVYINAEKGITVCCWVDGLIIVCKIEEAVTWFHTQIPAKYDTKGINRLTPSNPIDYLSIRITLRDDVTLTLDNEAKINVFLTEQGMAQCNETKTPLTRESLLAMHMGPETTANKQLIRNSLRVATMTIVICGQVVSAMRPGLVRKLDGICSRGD